MRVLSFTSITRFIIGFAFRKAQINPQYYLLYSSTDFPQTSPPFSTLCASQRAPLLYLKIIYPAVAITGRNLRPSRRPEEGTHTPACRAGGRRRAACALKGAGPMPRRGTSLPRLTCLFFITLLCFFQATAQQTHYLFRRG